MNLWEGREPLLDDSRLERLEHKLRSEFGHKNLDDATFVTFISPAHEANVTLPSGVVAPTWVQEMATFAVYSPNPRPYAKAKGLQLMTHGTVALEDWEEDERDISHYVNRPDPAHRIYRKVVEEHLTRMTNLREMI